MNIIDDIAIEYHPDGKVRMVYEIHPVTAYPHGLYVDWHENGQKWEECTTVNGYRHGLSRFWATDGELIHTKYYIDGQEMSDKIRSLVADINNITPQEKTKIAIEFGILL